MGAIGDSVTDGMSRARWGLLGRYSWFAHAVADGDLPYTWNAAQSNQTTEWIAARFGSELLPREPAVAAILAGTNDVLHGLPVERPLALLERMIDRAQEADVAVVLGTLPPFTAAATAVIDLNDGVRALAGERRVALVDFHAVLDDGHGRFAHGMSRDGLHPSEAGARAMGAAAIPVLRAALRARESR